MEDVLTAAFMVAHGFKPDGVSGLARKMGRNPGTLSNQLNPEQETAKLGLGDAVGMSIAAEDFRILHAFADTCGFVAFPKPDLSSVSDSSLLSMILKRDKELGDFARVLDEALANGVISDSKFLEIKVEAYQAAAALFELVERLKGLCRGR